MRRLQPLAGSALVLAAVMTAARSPAGQTAAPRADRTITQSNCVASRLGSSIPASAIGEPVASVTLDVPRWLTATNNVPAHCAVDGTITPVDRSATARAINFRVVLPAAWSGRSAQFGGGGMNGSIPNLTANVVSDRGASPLQRGFVTYGSDSGHQSGRGGAPAAGGRGAEPGRGAGAADWALNDEAIRNFGYLQMKKTRDAAMVLIDRVYRERPRFNYYFGTSQGGREALTVAQRYPADYDGIVANVPVVSFSSLMLAPEWIRIHEKPIANWVPPAKVNVIRGEFMRQCDGLDGLADGIVNNYIACRAIFDMTQGSSTRNPWIVKRCPDNVDPDPADTSAAACLTDGQISTLKLVYTPYRFATPLANGVTSFGMWTPNTDPAGSGLIANVRYQGQEAADEDAAMHSHLGVLGVTGFLMKDLGANPLDYVEGGPLSDRRRQLSEWLDATDPDLSRFASRGGRMIVTIGTNDTLASPGAQLDYYQSVIDTMGRSTVDGFARLFVIPQAGHGLTGSNYGVTGTGETIPIAPLANAYNRIDVLVDWVENRTAPPLHATVSSGNRSLPLCSYPMYPRYVSGPRTEATSYICAQR
jgi:pimeloyl-ACP methyl ester carboxylesterase